MQAHSIGLIYWTIGLLSLPTIGNSAGFQIIPSQYEEFGRSGDWHRDRAIRDVTSFIPTNYSANELPPTQNRGPVRVKMSVVIMNVRDINEIGEEISAEFNIRLYWKEARLSHLVSHFVNSPSPKPGPEFILLRPSIISDIWHPDVFIDHAKKIEQPKLLSLPASVRMYPDNTLRYSGRITATVSCKMDFHYYPADTQRCHFDLMSYAYSDGKMILSWREKNGAEFAYEIDLSNYYVGLGNLNSFTIKTGSGNSYSGLRFTVLLTRKLSYHMIQTYLPSIVLVFISWLSFLVSPDSVPARMTMLMTCLLTLIAMFASVRQNTPNVSYIKSIDIWMVMCVFFVFLALVEFTLVLKIKTMKLKPKDRRKQREESIHKSRLNSLRESRENGNSIYHPNSLPARRGSGPRIGIAQTIEEETELDYITTRRGAPEYGDNSLMARRPPLPLPTEGQLRMYSRPIPKAQYSTVTTIPPSSSPRPPTSVSRNDKIITKIEQGASIFIPTLFIVSNFLYWPWLIISSDYYNQETVLRAF